jgi:hypothetical protein
MAGWLDGVGLTSLGNIPEEAGKEKDGLAMGR